MSQGVEFPHIDRFDYVGGSYPMGIRPEGEYVEYDDHVAIVRQLAEQRAELLGLVDAITRGRAHCFIPTDDPSRPTFNWDERAEVAIANATQQRNATGGEG